MVDIAVRTPTAIRALAAVSAGLWRDAQMVAAVRCRDIGTVYRGLVRENLSLPVIARLTGQTHDEVDQIVTARHAWSVNMWEQIGPVLGIPPVSVDPVVMGGGAGGGGAAGVAGVPRERVLVVYWTGAQVRALRVAARMGLREFGDRLGVRAEMMSRWEVAGASRRPRPFSRSLLDTHLRVADHDVRARFVAGIVAAGPVGAVVGAGGRLLVIEWTGREAGLLRLAMGESARAFAQRLGVSDRIVTKWEGQGRATRPGPVSQAVLDTSLTRAGREVHQRLTAALSDDGADQVGGHAPSGADQIAAPHQSTVDGRGGGRVSRSSVARVVDAAVVWRP